MTPYQKEERKVCVKNNNNHKARNKDEIERLTPYVQKHVDINPSQPNFKSLFKTMYINTESSTYYSLGKAFDRFSNSAVRLVPCSHRSISEVGQ